MPQDIFEDMAAGRLSSDEYPYVRQPSASTVSSFSAPLHPTNDSLLSACSYVGGSSCPWLPVGAAPPL